ncbi:DUF433 domain-containing protein [Deferrisoma camini]|uniref:DUF433 domain-containing protein n=1 Tax=Deferrisoma camini TaxID=1035120 RepID=UPI000A040599|nr:DUF433 domain-containing protein [Deferrisoma camini]
MPSSRITSTPHVMFGKPVIQGTRITVEFILEELAAGRTPEDLAREHPGLEVEDVRAALRFAAQILGTDIVHPVSEEAA